MSTPGTATSTCVNARNNVVSDASGRKTKTVDSIVANGGTEVEDSVFVSLGCDDAIVFSDEVESVPSLEEDTSDDEGEDDDENVGSDDESVDEDDVELEEGLAERLRILADCRALKNLATAFLHPEKPVATNPTEFGRNFFDRPSAPEIQDDEDVDEEAEIFEDMRELKEAARAYLHPEIGVTKTAGENFGRNYFSRHSAPETECAEDSNERARVFAEAMLLKSSATAYMHPEVGVKTADGAVLGRNYFDRYSALEVEEDEFADERAKVVEEAAALRSLASEFMHPEASVAVDSTCFGRNYFNRPSAAVDEDVEERAIVLADVMALKKSAADYLHPEVGVKTTDGAAFGRNYFSRFSAPEVEEDEFADERAEILEEATALKKLSADFMHPEAGVPVDGTCFGRNYFNRPSAAVNEDDEEQALVLADAMALKKLAVDYMHPEAGVKSTDGAAFGRNYFIRFSAPEVEEDEFADERAEVLEEVAALKKLAVDFAHPEAGVSVDGTCFGRNYFERFSAVVDDEAEERGRVLADTLALKKSVADFVHPEIGVKTSDGAAFGRNYFSRYSAPDVEEDELADERAEILEEVASLKKVAADFMHPEVGVVVNSECFGRSYFDRPSAAAEEGADERSEVLADALALKKSATDYMHPEVGVKTTDGAAFGRNYFNRHSAPEVEEDEFADERAEILEEAIALKKVAADFMHPEVGVSVESTCFGRNYFDRVSAAVENEDTEERALVIADMLALKKSASDFMHPEVGVKTADGAIFGRNYFSRFSAPDLEADEFADERAQILEESAALKRLASDYLHPEEGVSVDSTCFGCNYFNRTSSTVAEDPEESVKVLADAVALKKLAADYMHPEVGIKTTDSAAFGRNYFNRYSAPEIKAPVEVVEQESPDTVTSDDMAVVKNLAAAVKGAHLPSTKSVKLSSFEKDVSASNKSASSVDLFGLSDEVH